MHQSANVRGQEKKGGDELSSFFLSVFSPVSVRTVIPGSFLLTHSAGDNSYQFTICCVSGVLEVSKSASCKSLLFF